MSQFTNIQQKLMKLRTDDYSKTDDLSSTSSMSYASDYAPYPRLALEDLEPVPDPFLSLPATPPPTPVASNAGLKIDHAFDMAALQVKQRNMASHVAEAFDGMKSDDSAAFVVKKKELLLYLVVLILGILFGLFII